MSHRISVRSAFEGKTVERVDLSVRDAPTFHFTDGTTVTLEVVYLRQGMAIQGSTSPTCSHKFRICADGEDRCISCGRPLATLAEELE
jgi:hypothetical protein